TRSFADNINSIAPKVKGALVLDKILTGQSPEFTVYFSSTGNIFPRLKFGQVGYNAGHEFLDVYAKARRMAGYNTFVFNSNDWHGVGIAEEASKTHAYKIKNHNISFSELLSVTPREGLYTLRTTIGNSNPQVAISPYDIDKLQDFINELDFAEIESGKSAEAGSGGRTRDELSAEYIAPSTDIHHKLVEVFQEIFRIDRIGIDDDFFELGGDSIKAISAISSMQHKHDLDLPITTFFDKRTIRNITAYLEGDDNSPTIDKTKKVKVETDFYDPFPVSPIQMAYLMGRSDQFDMGGISTNVYQESEISLDLGLLNSSFNKMLNRHPMLKIHMTDDGQQQFHDTDNYEIKNTDLRKSDEKAQKKFIETERKRLNNYLFNEKKWPLFEISTCTLADNQHYLFFCFDHLICDAASLMILVKEWGKMINNPEANLPALQYTYRDYIIDFQEQRNSNKFEKSKEYWLDQVDTFPSAPAIPTRIDPSEITKPKFSRQRKLFSADEWSSLKLKAKEHNVTPSVLLCAAYARVLSEWSNSEEIAINLTLFNRHPFHPDVQQIVGDFTMLVLLGISCDPGKNFVTDVKEVQKSLLEALDNRFYDGIDFIRELRKVRKLGTSAVMPYVFTSALFDSELTATEDDEVLGIWGKQRDSGMAVSQTSQVFIDCTSAELNGELELVWDHVEELFDKEVIEAMFSQFISIIADFIAGKTVNSLQIPESHEKLIDRINQTQQPNQPGKTIVELFEKQVAKTPDQPALYYDNEILTYKELNSKANQLARELIAKGIKTEKTVALVAERSFEMMISVFAIMKSGGVYLPIATSTPKDRIAYILNDAAVELTLVQPEFINVLPATAKKLNLNDPSISKQNADNLETKISAEQLAYIIYTSGSTGEPKGVMIEHHSLVNRLNWMQNAYQLTDNDQLLQKTPISFDVSLWELFWWTLAGASLKLLPKDEEKSPERLLNELTRHPVSIIHFVPSMLELFLNYLEESSTDVSGLKIRYIFCSGEELLASHVDKFNRVFEKTNCQLVNLYGPTEATIDVSYFNCEKNASYKVVPIGKPIDNTQLYILNDQLMKVPIGTAGQLYIGGVGVARGYINKQALTRDKFLDDPLHTNQVLYATGDRVRMQADGEIIYLGRMDSQVKLRGNRIELGEIENRLTGVQGVDQAVVMLRTDHLGLQYLCAYLVAKNEIDSSALRRQLSEWLPEYMIPARYQYMEEIPLTANGKVNRRLLPDPGVSINISDEKLLPQSETEHTLAAIYSEILNVEDPGINESFFDLGGDSFKATFLITSIQKSLGIKVTLAQIFKTSNIMELASAIENQSVDAQPEYEPISKVAEQEYYPLSGAQKRLFTQHGQNKNTVTLNIFMNQKITGNLDHERFEDAFRKVINRHEILRTYFELREGSAYQRIIPIEEKEFVLAYEDLRFAIDLETQIANKTDEIANHAFDLSEKELYKVKLLRIAETEYIILFAIHHIIFDLWSQEVFFSELFHFYNASDQDPASALPIPAIQYKDYTAWHNKLMLSDEMKSHQNYWTNKLSGNLQVLQLPTDRSRPPIQTFAGDEVTFEIPAELIPQVRQYVVDQEATLFIF
ncbi:MAG: amino acid adenylation domain-containing protein, partial [Cyclobacteriaceae bacterium]